jgi:error-prone DNA polymerase
MIRCTGISGQSEQQMIVEQWDRSRVASGVAISIVKGNSVAGGTGEAQESVTSSNNPTRALICVLLTILGTSWGSSSSILCWFHPIPYLGRKTTEISHNFTATRYTTNITFTPGKLYFPLEFYVAIFNQQPMGFYSLETLKEDARRHGIQVLNPDINLSVEKCTIHHESVLLGLSQVRSIGEKGAKAIVEARNQGGPFTSLADAMQRTGLKQRCIENLVYAGAFDALTSHRADALWEVGLRYRPASLQLPLPLSVEQDMAPLAAPTSWQNMNQEYYSLGLYPKGYIMASLRPYLDRSVLTTEQVRDLPDGTVVTVAGSITSLQRPLGRAVFIVLRDEHGQIPLMAFPKVFEQLRTVLDDPDGPLVTVRGVVSRRDNTMSITVLQAWPIKAMSDLPKARRWN